MSLIHVNAVKGVFSPERKAEMILRLTDAMVTIESENLLAVTWIKVDDIERGHWGTGGQALASEAVKALADGKTPVAAR